MATGKKDLALCLVGTYFAVQSAFNLNVKGEKRNVKRGVHFTSDEIIIYITA